MNQISELSEKNFKACIITMLQQSIINFLETNLKNGKSLRKSILEGKKCITELENVITEIKKLSRWLNRIE